jgi:hypothetical protein
LNTNFYKFAMFDRQRRQPGASSIQAAEPAASTWGGRDRPLRSRTRFQLGKEFVDRTLFDYSGELAPFGHQEADTINHTIFILK